MADGHLVSIGPTADIIGEYVARHQTVIEEADVEEQQRIAPEFGERVRILRVRLDHPNGIVSADDDLRFSVVIRSTENLGPVRIGQSIFATDGTCVGSSFSKPEIMLTAGTEATVDVAVPHPRLAPGHYSLALGVSLHENAGGLDSLDIVADSVQFEAGAELLSGSILKWDGARARCALRTPLCALPRSLWVNCPPN